MGQERGSHEQREGGQPPKEPAQEDLDHFFEAACLARVFLGGTEQDAPSGRRPIQELVGESLQTLHQALSIRKEGVPYHCPCPGDLTIKLIGDAGKVAILSLHYHARPLLHYEGWIHDAELGERHELFKLLTRCGLEPALQNVERELRADEKEYADHIERLWLRGPGRIPMGKIFTEASKKQDE